MSDSKKRMPAEILAAGREIHNGDPGLGGAQTTGQTEDIPASRGRRMKNRTCSLRHTLEILSVLPLAALLGGCPAAVRLVPGTTSAVIQNGTTLATAIPVMNQGKKTAESVHVTSVSVKNGSQTIPGTLIAGPKSIGVGARAPVYANFPSTALLPGNTYLMRIRGTYTLANGVHHFTFLNPFQIISASPGSAVSSSATAHATRVTGEHYPHSAPNFPAEIAEINEGGWWTVPIGPERELSRTPRETSIQPAPPPNTDPPSLEIFANDPLNIPGNSVNEPSGAASGLAANGGVVFATFNSSAAFSTNDGQSWTSLDPTTIFPQTTGGGFCCDQVVQFIPSIDSFVWVLQYCGMTCGNATGPNLERVVACRPADMRIGSLVPCRTTFDITPALLGLGNDFFDFPDLSVGNNFLYLSFDDFNAGGLIVTRIPLSEIQAAGTINIQFTHPGDSSQAYLGHLTQSPLDSIFWAGHNSNSSMRVFSWPETSASYSWQDVDVGSWPNNISNMTSTTPDGMDWLSKLQKNNTFPILGSTRVTGSIAGVRTDQLFFAWTGSNGSGFLQPQVQWVALDRSNNFNLVTQQQLFSDSATVAYPALASNSNGEVGISAETGGGGAFENHAIGFLADNFLKITTNSNVGVNRFGDFVTIRQNVADGTKFDAFGYGMDAVSDTRYIVFGRGATPMYDHVALTITTGNDNAEGGSEIIAMIAGQSVPLCLKPSTSLPPDGICANSSGATDQNGNNNWPNWHVSTFSKNLDTPQASASGFSTITISLLQSSCETYCDNWDLQGITVVVSDTTGTLPPVTLLNNSMPSHQGNNCIARLKAAPNPNSAIFPLDQSNGGGIFPADGSSVCTSSNS